MFGQVARLTKRVAELEAALCDKHLQIEQERAFSKQLIDGVTASFHKEVNASRQVQRENDALHEEVEKLKLDRKVVTNLASSASRAMQTLLEEVTEWRVTG